VNEEFSILGDSPVSPDGDCLNFKSFVVPFATRLIASRPNTPFTVGIFADWGQGKTTVMRMLQFHLRNSGCPTIWFDPWKYNTRESVWKGLMLTIVTTIQKNDSLIKEIRRKSTFLKDLLAEGLVASIVGTAWANKIVKAVKTEPWSPSLLHEFESTLATLFELIDPNLRGNQFDKPLVLFVDDLDRCMPESALAVLEALKLVLEKPGLITIVGIAESELSRAVHAAYSKELSITGRAFEEEWGQKYIGKIIQMPFSLPIITQRSLDDYVGQCLITSRVDEALGKDPRWRAIIREACGENLREIKRFINNFISEMDKAAANSSDLATRHLSFSPTRVAFILLLAWRFKNFVEHIRKQANDPELLIRYQLYFLQVIKDGHVDANLLRDRDESFQKNAGLSDFFGQCFAPGNPGIPPLVVPFAGWEDLGPYLQFGYRADANTQITEISEEKVSDVSKVRSVNALQMSNEVSTIVSGTRAQIASNMMEEAERSLLGAIDLARRNKDQYGEEVSLILLGQAKEKLGERPRALELFQSALTLARALKDLQGQWNCLINIARVFRAAGENFQAVDHTRQALDITRQTGDRLGEQNVLEELAMSHAAVSDFNLAIRAYAEAREIARSLNNQSAVMAILLSMSRVDFRAQQLSSAMSYAQQAQTLAGELGDWHSLAEILLVQARIQRQLKDHHSTVALYEQASDASEKNKEHVTTAGILSELGSYFEKRNDDKNALECYERALQIFINIGSETGVLEIRVAKSRLARKHGSIPEASSSAAKTTLQFLVESKGHVIVTPIVPQSSAQDYFQVQQIDLEILLLFKTSNEQTVEIPLRRVIEILPNANNDPAVLELSGRLQFLTLAKRWKFFPETVPSDSDYGLGKASSPEDLQSRGIYAQLDQKQIPYCWDSKNNLSGRLAKGWMIFYDDDGRYLRYVVSPSDQIFLTRLTK
jgi:tetratricopeptide (TPR) repeat protein